MVNGVSLATFFLFLMIPSTFSLEFNLTSITNSDNSKINTTAPGSSAYISPSQGIQLIPYGGNVSEKVGRATYVEPLHLWDKASGNLTDFTTHFTFFIDSNRSDYFGDGLAFFLAPVNSTVGDLGGNLGLAHGNATLNNSAEPFFAVEFDTYSHPWDPFDLSQRPYTHVGIDINNMVSVKTERWGENISGWAQNEAWISYNGTTKNLTVIFTRFPSGKTQNGSLSYQVDMREFLPEWVMFGFSAAAAFQTIINVKSWDFNSSLKLSLHPQELSTSPSVIPNIDLIGGKKKNWTGLLIGLSVVLFFFIGLSILGYVLWRRKRKRNDFLALVMDDEFENGNGPKRFSYKVLEQATNHFAKGEKLGQGGFGVVYKGFLRDENRFIAVKKVSSRSSQGLKEYASEVKIISRLNHRNLLQLIGWCHERGDLLLVYEFMPNGSLDFHLFKGNSRLNWEMRYKIAQGLASALLYLHEDCHQCVLHRDIKSSNVLLDSMFNAKLGDFGLAKLVDHENGAETTMVLGTLGYIAPEYLITGRVSKESDVYSFGVVALEIACGRKSINIEAEGDAIRTVDWVWDLYRRGKLLEAVDPELNSNFEEKEMERLLIVALWCTHPDNSLRLSIRQAFNFLYFQAEIPSDLPSNMPPLTYFSPLNSLPRSISQSGIVQPSEDKDLQSSGCGIHVEILNAPPTPLPPTKLGLPKKLAKVIKKKTGYIFRHAFGRKGNPSVL